MSKSGKIVVVAVCLIVVGLIIFAAAMLGNGFDFIALGTAVYNSNSYQITDWFTNISMNTDTADIVFEKSDDGNCRVICYEQEKVRHSVSVSEGTLFINVVDERKWHEHIGIIFDKPKITICLPEDEYDLLNITESTGDVKVPDVFRFEEINIITSTGDVKIYASSSGDSRISTNTGDIYVKEVTADTLELSVTTGRISVNSAKCKEDVKINVDTGDVKLTDVSCRSLYSGGDTGDLSLNGVVAVERFIIERDTGDVIFDGCDAQTISVKTDTGVVKGSLLTEKVFFAETDTGSVDVPKTLAGGKCEVRTDTGDIKITIK